MPPCCGARAQRELHDLVAEILGIGDARRLLDLRQLLVQQLAVHQLPGVGVLVVLVLDPGVGIGDIAVEQVLAVIAVGFEIGLLDLVADELGVARRELALDEAQQLLLGVLARTARAGSTAPARTSDAPGSAETSCVSKLKVLDSTLKAKRVESPFMPSSTPAASRYSCTVLARGSLSLRLSPS